MYEIWKLAFTHVKTLYTRPSYPDLRYFRSCLRDRKRLAFLLGKVYWTKLAYGYKQVVSKWLGSLSNDDGGSENVAKK